jgi:hypothetical protein
MQTLGQLQSNFDAIQRDVVSEQLCNQFVFVNISLKQRLAGEYDTGINQCGSIGHSFRDQLLIGDCYCQRLPGSRMKEEPYHDRYLSTTLCRTN